MKIINYIYIYIYRGIFLLLDEGLDEVSKDGGSRVLMLHR